jgi:hypothetical protein
MWAREQEKPNWFEMLRQKLDWCNHALRFFEQFGPTLFLIWRY